MNKPNLELSNEEWQNLLSLFRSKDDSNYSIAEQMLKNNTIWVDGYEKNPHFFNIIMNIKEQSPDSFQMLRDSKIFQFVDLTDTTCQIYAINENNNMRIFMGKEIEAEKSFRLPYMRENTRSNNLCYWIFSSQYGNCRDTYCEILKIINPQCKVYRLSNGYQPSIL